MKNESGVKNATVKKDGRKVQVYKLQSGGWNIYLGEKLNMTAVDQKQHQETFKDEELDFTD